MSCDIQAILKNLHLRITALEGKATPNLGTLPDFWSSRLIRLYENLKQYQCSPNNNERVGWQVKEKQNEHFIAGKGYRNGTYYSIEIENYQGLFQITCWEYPEDEDEQPECISQMCEYVDDVKAFLDSTFPL